jgi:hypothetical protein
LFTPAGPTAKGTVIDAAVTGTDCGEYANQPASDSVTVESDSATDVGKVVTIYSTLNGAQSSIFRGTATIGAAATPVDFTLLDGTAVTSWHTVLAVEFSAAMAGTVVLKEKSGGQTIKSLATPTAAGNGVSAVAAAAGACYGLPVQAYAGAASTKKLGVWGTDPYGNFIGDVITLAGTTVVNGLHGFHTVTKILAGDVAAASTAHVEIGETTLSSSQHITGKHTATFLATVDPGINCNVAIGSRYFHWIGTNATGTGVATNGAAGDWVKLILYP